MRETQAKTYIYSYFNSLTPHVLLDAVNTPSPLYQKVQVGTLFYNQDKTPKCYAFDNCLLCVPFHGQWGTHLFQLRLQFGRKQINITPD